MEIYETQKNTILIEILAYNSMLANCACFEIAQKHFAFCPLGLSPSDFIKAMPSNAIAISSKWKHPTWPSLYMFLIPPDGTVNVQRCCLFMKYHSLSRLVQDIEIKPSLPKTPQTLKDTMNKNPDLPKKLFKLKRPLTAPPNSSKVVASSAPSGYSSTVSITFIYKFVSTYLSAPNPRRAATRP